jgi:hypothetical protein
VTGTKSVRRAPKRRLLRRNSQNPQLLHARKVSDEKLPPHPARQERFFRDFNISNQRDKAHSVGQAKAAGPSSRLLYSKPPLGSLTKVNSAPKAKPSDDTEQGAVDRGLAAAYFGANSVASALNLPQERDSLENHLHSNPNLFLLPSKQDISTLLALGHFYFALTILEPDLQPQFNLPWIVRAESVGPESGAAGSLA